MGYPFRMNRWFKSLAALTFFAASFLSFAVQEVAAGNSRPLTVVELFTSQGCSSCPPADAYLGDLAQLDESEGILALSFHVDYWNNLGWKDPYSSADNTRRQRAYARYMDLRYVYTPQMVIQGALQATGSDRRTIQHQIKTARKMPRVDVRLTRTGDSMQVTLAENGHPVTADVYMVVFDKEHTTKVKRGENRGKTITNRNVVRLVERIGAWDGGAAKMSSPLNRDGDACAVIVQSPKSGTILGAAKIILN